MDKRDGKFGPQPMAVPPPQVMSRIDQAAPPAIGYPPQGYPQHPPPGYPQNPPANPQYPPGPAYPPQGYPK